jgi:hypothetical protein
MTKRKTQPVRTSSSDWFVARRRGNWIRMQSRVTGAMTTWARVPEPIQPAMRTVRISGRRAGKATAHRAEARRAAKLPVLHNRATLEGMRVADIRTAAQTVFGETFKSKARKAEMIDAYLALQEGRIRTIEAMANHNGVNA